MRKLLPFICCLILVGCKEEPIPTVTMQILPAELVYAGDSMQFDTTRYEMIEILRDTITPDSIVLDTLRIDTFSLDTFWMDTIRLVGTMTCNGNPEVGPAIQEYGFCIGDLTYYPVEKSEAKETPIQVFDTFRYVLPIRYDRTVYVRSYAINPFGIIRSESRAVIVPKLDPR